MSTITKLAVPALAVLLTSSAGAALAQYGPPAPPPPQAYGPAAGGWDVPSGEMREIERQGFHDGVDGARHDVDNHRYPNVNNRDEFRHPHVPGYARRDYRQGFRRGYNVAMQHLYYGGGPRPY